MAPFPSSENNNEPSLAWEIAQNGQSDEIRSPDACARTVVRRTPGIFTMPVVCIGAISLRSDLRMISRPLESVTPKCAFAFLLRDRCSQRFHQLGSAKAYRAYIGPSLILNAIAK